MVDYRYKANGKPKATETLKPIERALIMQTYDYNILKTIVEVPSRSIQGIEALEDHISKLNNESGNAESIGESHVRIKFASENIALEVEVTRKDTDTDNLSVYGWDATGQAIKPKESENGKALIEHLEKLRG